MKITLSLEAELVKKLRKIAFDHDTTLTEMVREYLQCVAQEDDCAEMRVDALRRALRKNEARLNYGKRNWTRADLYERRQ